LVFFVRLSYFNFNIECKKFFGEIIKDKIYKLILILISFSAIFCEDKSTENISSNSKKYEIVLSDWNGKMGVEDHIIQIKTDGSFIQTAIGWEELCGNLTDKEYGEIIFQLNNINPFKINLFHNNLCTDADGEKQNTKLVITDIEKNKTNKIGRASCRERV